MIPGLGRSPGEGLVTYPGNPFQYSCLKKPMDRGAWLATVHGVTRIGHDLPTKPPPPSYTVGGNVNWYSHYGEQYGGSLKKLKIESPSDPTIPLLGIYLKKILKHTCTPVFTLCCLQ